MKAKRATGEPTEIRGRLPWVWPALGLLVGLLLAPPPAVLAATSPPAGALAQVGERGGWISESSYGGNWAQPDDHYYYTDALGNLAIVRHRASDSLAIDTFDPSTLQRIGQTRSISLSGWPDWGGFYAAPDGDFYVLVGRDNLAENDDRDVVAVRRYDSDWNLIGTAYVKGGATQGGVKGIYVPFDASAPDMVLAGNRLVIHMARLIYERDGVHHQVNLTFEVDVDSMTAITFDDLGDVSYSSHSFRQLVAMHGSDLVMVDHGDAYPRSVRMGVMHDYPAQRDVDTDDLFPFNGEIGNNFTGATLNGLVSGPSGVVVLGSSIRHPDAPDGPLGSSGERRNIYAIAANPATGAHTVHWLTNFAPHGADRAFEPRVVQVGVDRFVVLFGARNAAGDRLEYRLIDSAGTELTSASFPGVRFYASSDPILVGSRILWVGSAPGSWPPPAYLYGINVDDPATPSLPAWEGPAMQPDTRVTKALVDRRHRMATFRFEAVGTANGFECKLKRKHARPASFGQCRSPKRYRHLKRGRYVFAVRALGSAGYDSSPVKKRFRIK